MSERARQAKIARKLARAARKRGADAEQFTPVSIFERDGWVCRLCTSPVDRSLRYPDPLSASVDHIVPFALGGAHTRANAQCSHLVCNIEKGARLQVAVA